MMSDNWKELYERRLDWALRSRKEFIEEIDTEEIRHSLSGQNEAARDVVVAMGRAQVGKTSLILRLLGVRKPDARQRVEDVLRGERTKGESATPTATIFSIAPDDSFRIRLPSESLSDSLSDAEAREKMVHVRQRVATKKASQTEAIRVELPRDTIQADSMRLKLDLVDLPGWGSSEREERTHVRMLVRNYLRRAHLVLLVERADNINSLQHQTLAGANPNWMFLDERFGIVLTRSVSASSIQKKIRDPEERPDSVESYVSLFRKKIRETTRGREADALCELPLYPVEFAESWEKLDDSIRAHAEGWIDGLLEALLQRVNRADAPIAALRQLIGRYQGVEEIRQQIQNKHEGKVETIESEIGEYESIIDGLRTRASRLRDEKRRWASLEEDLPSPKEVIPRGVGTAEKRRSSGASWKVWDSELPGELVGHLNMVESNVEERKDETLKKLRELADERDFDEKANIGRLIEKNVVSKILTQKREIREKSFIVKSEKWKGKVNEVVEKVNKNEKRVHKEATQKYLDKLEEKCKNKKYSLLRKVESLEEKICQKAEQVEKLESDLKRKEDEHEKKMDNLDRDFKRWKQLEQRFRDSYRSEMKRRKKKIESANNDYCRIAHMALMFQIRDDFEALIG